MNEKVFVDQLVSAQNINSPAWLRSIQAEGKSQFEKLGFPTERRGNEDWKYTDVSSLSKTNFNIAQHIGENLKNDEQCRRLLLTNQDAYMLCFTNGIFNKSFSVLPQEDSAVIAGPLSESATTFPDFVKDSLGGIAEVAHNPFTALNTGFIREGAFLKIPPNTSIREPIYLQYIADAQESPIMSHPRNLILVGRDSKATIVEIYIGVENCEYLTNAVTEIVLEPGAHLNYYKVQHEDAQAYHISSTTILQENDSTIALGTIDLGGKLVRNQINVVMTGKGSSCDIKGLFYAEGKQHMDNQIFIDHRNSDTTSKELFKGVLDGESHGVFHGSITVRPGVARVDALQNDKNLLLSPKAKMDTKPAFWIYSNDVKCSHGATCSRLDDESMFYLHSRGLDSVSAKKLLVNGFVSEILDTFQEEPIKERLYQVISEKLNNYDER